MAGTAQCKHIDQLAFLTIQELGYEQLPLDAGYV